MRTEPLLCTGAVGCRFFPYFGMSFPVLQAQRSERRCQESGHKQARTEPDSAGTGRGAGDGPARSGRPRIKSSAKSMLVRPSFRNAPLVQKHAACGTLSSSKRESETLNILRRRDTAVALIVPVQIPADIPRDVTHFASNAAHSARCSCCFSS